MIGLFDREIKENSRKESWVLFCVFSKVLFLLSKSVYILFPRRLQKKSLSIQVNLTVDSEMCIRRIVFCEREIV